ncbi:MAG: hypothetical protein AAF497_16055, partial [Planctomycetota bacterium]
PKPFVDELEPFDPARERRLRLGQEKEGTPLRQGTILTGGGRSRLGDSTDDATPTLADANRQRKVSSSGEQLSSAPGQTNDQTGPSPSIAHRRRVESGKQTAIDDHTSRDVIGGSISHDEFDVIAPSDRAVTALDGNARRHGPDPELARVPYLERLDTERKLNRTLKAVETLVMMAKEEGYVLAADYLQRYVGNEGGVSTLPWLNLRQYEPFQDAENRVRSHYENWFFGKNEDKTVGQPFLSLKKGKTLTLGTDGAGSPVMWEADWEPWLHDFVVNEIHPADVATREQDFMLAFGDAVIKGYGNIDFLRRGDVILVNGFVDMRFDERYDFEDDIGLAGFATHYTLDTPNVLAHELSNLADHGLAKPFSVQSSQLWAVSGYIKLVDGKPDGSKSNIVWREVETDAP